MPPKKSGNEFKWSDDEAELLLTVTQNYKVTKIAEGTDWESVKSKYADILELMREELPSTAEESNRLTKDYPHTKEQMTKVILTTKLKAIRLKFRQAVDSGRRSGHGRVVMLYYELCERVWGGSPATEQIEAGVESTDIEEVVVPPSTSTSVSSLDEDESEEGDGGGAAIADGEPNEPVAAAAGNTTVQHRRELLNDKLKNYRQEKLKRKIPVDAQLLECAKEELQVKKRLVDQMYAVDKEYSENMTKLSGNMEKLTNSISDGFSLLRNLLTPQPQPMYPYQQMYSNPHPLSDLHQQRPSSPY